MKAKEHALEPQSLGDRTPGELLRDSRVRHEVSQKELAVRAGTTQSAIARIERGRTSPSVRTLATLFEAMGEDLVLGVRLRESGVDLTLNRKNLEHDSTERLERSLGFSDLAAQLRGETSDRKAA
jgi:transcriptional regulator with XRE-family HTH domain